MRLGLPEAQAGAARRLRAAALAVLAFALVLAGLRLAPHEPLAARFGASVAVFARDGTLLRLTLAPDGQYRLWTPLAQIAPVLVDGVLLYEDRRFHSHPGVDPAALVRAAWHSARGGRRIGGSTITMQLARRLHRLDTRRLPGKLAQIGAALWLEARFGKREILEAYLNTVPYGANIEGIGAASLVYFRKPAAQLALPEALTLAVIPQNPVKRIASRGANPELQAARERLWALWQQAHPAQAREHAPEALLAPPAQARASLPFAAPHLTDMLLRRVEPGQREIHATLDPRMQRTLERVVANYLRERADVGLRNASALLVDAARMEVRAVIGSAGYRDAAIEGQVNGTLAKRSPGSTLKPFIYALALDQGLLHPKTILKDAPSAFGAYTPENFDGRFAGPLTAQDALIRSRNVPAIAVAARLAKPGLHGFLRLNHVSRLQSESHYGLALVLGGGELTMEELARLYSLLPNAGEMRPLAYTREQARENESAARPRLLSPEAAFVTLDMLRHTPRPDSGAPAAPAVAWKTGTSWGFRDAWTAGVFGRHVLVVWVGEFDGASNPAFVGIQAAAPLFLRIVDALRAEGLDPGGMATTQSENLREVEVCAATGAPPDALCPARTRTWFIAGKSPIQPGTLHQAVWVDARSGRPLCGPDPERQPHARRIVIERWDSDMQRHFRQSGLPRREWDDRACGDAAQPPAGAATAQAAGAPRIGSPLRGVSYLRRAGRAQPLTLHAEAAAGVRVLYWFADDALVARAAPGEAVAWTPPQAGSYLLRVVDDQGRAESRALTVEDVD